MGAAIKALAIKILAVENICQAIYCIFATVVFLAFWWPFCAPVCVRDQRWPTEEKRGASCMVRCSERTVNLWLVAQS